MTTRARTDHGLSAAVQAAHGEAGSGRRAARRSAQAALLGVREVPTTYPADPAGDHLVDAAARVVGGTECMAEPEIGRHCSAVCIWENGDGLYEIMSRWGTL